MKKIIAIEKAFYNGNIVKAGEIIEITDDKKVPEWAKVLGQTKDVQEETVVTQGTLIPDKQTIKEKAGKTEETVETDEVEETQTETEETVETDEVEETQTETEDVQDELVGKTDEKLELILDELLTKALDRNIYIEDADKKTVIEQINELKSKLAEPEGAEA